MNKDNRLPWKQLEESEVSFPPFHSTSVTSFVESEVIRYVKNPHPTFVSLHLAFRLTIHSSSHFSWSIAKQALCSDKINDSLQSFISFLTQNANQQNLVANSFSTRWKFQWTTSLNVITKTLPHIQGTSPVAVIPVVLEDVVPAILQSLDEEANDELSMFISTDNLGNRIQLYLNFIKC